MMPSRRSGASVRFVISSVRRNFVLGVDPVRVDWAVAAVLLVAFELQIWTASDQQLRWVQAVNALAIAGAVAVRRRWTLQGLLAAGVVLLVKQALLGGKATGHGLFGLVGIVLVFYGAGAFLDGRRVWIGLALTVVVGTAITLNGSSLLGAIVGFVAFVLLPWIVGRARRLSAARERASRELAERTDSERELHVRAAALTERTRLAREIHDVIAHSVSVMVIQAAGARTVMDVEPDRAEASLRAVERAGREALAEMRRLLGVLASGEELRALAPQPGLEDLPELVSSTRAAGLRASIPGRGAAGRGLARSESVRLSGRAGGADQYAQARRPNERRGQRAVATGRARTQRDRRRWRPERACDLFIRPWNRRHARAGGAPRRERRSRPRSRWRVRCPSPDPAAVSEHDMSARRPTERWSYPRITAEHVDWLISVALVVDLVLEAAVGRGIPDRLVTALFAVPFALMVAFRRRWPGGALLCATALCVAQDPLEGQLFNLPSGSAVIVLVLCSYGAGAWVAPRRAQFTIGLASSLLCADQLVETYVTHVSGGGVSGFATLMVLFIAPWVLGWFVSEHHRRADAFTALAAHAAAERAERERSAIAQERLTIGRELQDIIAHSVSVMVVQAGGARRLLHDEPDRARESIVNVERTGREALADMRRLLGLLRKDDDPRALAPQPGLDQLAELVDAMTDAGLSCELRTEGASIDLTPGIDLVAYRVIETALEGATAGGCQHARATVRYAARGLELEIDGERRLADLDDRLQAVSERVELYGGDLAVVDSPPAGFAIRCRLPLEGAEA
jgi:signal transduction histidine kinase